MSADNRKNLRDMLDELDRYFENFENEIQQAMKENLNLGFRNSQPFVAGFSIKLGPEGKPSMQIFGDSPVSGDGYRSPLTEQTIDPKSGTLRLVLDMPGVEKKDISVDARDDSAVITAEGPNRKYKAEISLKAPVLPESGKAEFRNGVLEILFSLKDKANKGFKRVDIV